VKVPARFRVGVATHTGVVRSTNEDDYLLLAPPAVGVPFALVTAVADGMGGVTGGAEASRTGLRGFASGLLGGPGADASAPAAEADELERAVRRAFAGACARVHQQSRLVPALRDMGTTLTAIAFTDAAAVLGHVGDTRAYRLRGGQLEQLTIDHAASDQQNRLLRCIGGGQSEETPDLLAFDVLAGDRFLLCSDGVWSTVGQARIVEALGRLDAQPAAARLVQLANSAGGTDNATALVVHVGPDRGAGGGGDAVEIDLPAEESSRAAELSRRAGGARAPLWPWLLLAVAVVVVVAVLLDLLFEVDLWLWLRSLVR
jgi:serine/threonine protein phosphatase PrpC